MKLQAKQKLQVRRKLTETVAETTTTVAETTTTVAETTTTVAAG